MPFFCHPDYAYLVILQGPTARCGMVFVGDEVHGVDGIRIHEMTIDQVQPKLHIMLCSKPRIGYLLPPLLTGF